MRAVVAASAAGGAAVVLLLVGTGLGWWSAGVSAPAATTPLTVRTSLAPSPAFFGDVLAAQVDVTSSAKKIGVLPVFSPYQAVAPPAVSRSRDGTVHYRFRIQCVSEECLPVGTPYRLRLAPVVVTAHDGSTRVAAKAAWPVTFVASRLSSRDLARVRFRHTSAPPAPTYAVSPQLLADMLSAAAGVLGLAAAGVLGLELVHILVGRRPRVQPTPLEAALLYTRESARRADGADRRKALALLAQTLETERMPTLAETAGRAAWAGPPPSPEAAVRLADEVERAGSGGG